MHRTRIKVAFFAIVCFVTVAFLEGLVRVVHTVRPVYEDKTTLYDDHERFHHWHKPDRAMRYRAVTGEFDVAVRTNEHGMAGPSVPMEHPPGVSRIAVLGDSFVEGVLHGGIPVLRQSHRDEAPQRDLVTHRGPQLRGFLILSRSGVFPPDGARFVVRAR